MGGERGIRVRFDCPCPQREARRPHHDYRGWERRGVPAVAKFEASSQQPDLVFHGILVPPSGVGAGWHQAYDRGAFVHRCVVSFRHPFSDLAPVGRVHEDHLLAPGPEQSVVFPCKVLRTLRVGVCRTRIERKPKLLVERVKQPLWRWPLWRLRGEVDLHALSSGFRNSSLRRQ